MDKFAEFRTHVPVAMKWSYFESAATGIIPDNVHDGVARYFEQRYLIGGDNIWELDGVDGYGTVAMMKWSKNNLGKMIGAPGEDIYFAESATAAYNVLVSGFQFRPGDNIVLPDEEWIGTRFAWQNKSERDGLELRYVIPHDGLLTAEDYIAKCDENTRMVCVDIVSRISGYLFDLKPLSDYCAERGIWVIVDAAHAWGVLPIDIHECKMDFVGGCDRKWMMNYCGNGFAYISPELRKEIRQTAAGWMSDSDLFNTIKAKLTLRDDASRYELGWPNVCGIYGLGIQADNYNKLGKYDIKEYVDGLVAYAIEQGKGIDGIRRAYDFAPERQSEILVFEVDEDVDMTPEDFEKENVKTHLQYSLSGRLLIRLGIHMFHTRDDIDAVMRVFRACSAKPRVKDAVKELMPY
ncbi:MAG: aminotransferase class V-fold PLP-dependent enzyme [Mogibacterium sp.]|nr:aminotransferase class V-fold PLP-dependent enzyme [Mogibacterium sp.]